MSKKAKPLAHENISVFFLDSGAHSLYAKYVSNYRQQEKRKRDVKALSVHKTHKDMYRGVYSHYETEAFWDYVDEYCDFVKKYKHAIDYYTSVDVIFHPELTWRVQKYIEEKHGLKPLPVIHHGTDIKWLKKYVEAGYNYIGVGGVGQEVTRQSYYRWADQVYDFICQTPDRTPMVKTHGFAVTAHELLFRYPWWSVDSSSWVKAGAYGMMYLPKWRKRDGKYQWVFNDTRHTKPHLLCFSDKLPKNYDARHYRTMNKMERIEMHRWLDEIGIPIGTNDEDGNLVDKGVINHYSQRNIANLRYYEQLIAELPCWPWKFTRRTHRGFFDQSMLACKLQKHKQRMTQMILFYSGQITGESLPERELADRQGIHCNRLGPEVMLTYFDLHIKRGNSTSRFKRHARRRE